MTYLAAGGIGACTQPSDRGADGGRLLSDGATSDAAVQADAGGADGPDLDVVTDGLLDAVADMVSMDIGVDGDASEVADSRAPPRLCLRPTDAGTPDAESGTCVGPIFTSPVDYSVGGSPSVVAIADFNGDGALDVVESDGNLRTFSIMQNEGNGLFVQRSSLASPLVGGIVAMDLDRDGNMDFAASDNNGNDVLVFFGKGDLTFRPAVTIPCGKGPAGVVAFDANGDGEIDLLTAGDGEVDVLLGLGNRKFKSVVAYVSGASFASMATGRLDSDGTQDLLVGDRDGGLTALLGKGDGTFVAKPAGSVGQLPSVIDVADFDGDGKVDLAVCAYDHIAVLVGNGDGTFTPKTSIKTEFGILVAGDFDGDGNVDLASGHRGTWQGGAGVVYLGNGDGCGSHGTHDFPSFHAS